MLPEIIGSFDCESCAAKAAERIRAEGFNTADLEVVSTVKDVPRKFKPEPDYGVSMKRGVIGGTIAGFLIGLAIVLYSGSSMFHVVGTGVLAIPLAEAFGWSLFGMILGGSGLLAERTLSPEAERRMEEELSHGRVLLAVQIHRHKDQQAVASALLHAGAMDVRQFGTFLA